MKKLNTESIKNELTGASAFFRAPASKPVARTPGMAPEEPPSTEAVSLASQQETQPQSDPAQQSEGVGEAKELKQRASVRPPDPYARTDDTAVRPSSLLDQVPSAPEQRRPERYAFQFWGDQITRLKKLKQVINITRDPDDRTEVTLSDLVREAVDAYLDNRTEEIRQSERTDEPAVRPYGQQP